MRLVPVLLLSACAPAEPVELVRAADWAVVAPDDDPFGPGPGCDAGSALQMEGEQLEIQTDRCGWVTLEQPALIDLHPGDRLELLLFQNALASVEEDAVAHLALRLAGDEFWSVGVPIPAEAEVHEPADSGFELQAGDPVVLHVSNHGQNTYRFDHLWIAP